jgi:ribonuclease Z
MKLTILGSSSALPTSERNPSAHVLSAHERFFLIDCGEGTQLQLRRHRVRFSRINHIFISHLHGDHVFGLYGLLSTFSLMGRLLPLHIYAPENYGPILRSHLDDFDIHLNFELDYHPLTGRDPARILDDKYLTVTAFPLEHRIPAYGFLFREKEGERKLIKECIAKHNIPISQMHVIKSGKDFVSEDGTIVKNEEITLPPPPPLSYAYCSDTRYFPQLANFIRGASLVYHEATFDNSKEELARITGHSTAAQAAKTAADAGAGSLIIGHFSSRYKDVAPLLDEARALFPSTFAAEDGKTYDAGNITPL